MEEMGMATLDLITASPHSSSSSSSSSSPTTHNNNNNNNHPSSSSSSSPSPSSSSSLCLSTKRTDLSTDLRLGLSLSPSQQLPSNYSTPSREQRSSFDWPPVKSTLRCTLVEKSQISLFVKVYMEGIPIGRKLNLLAHHNYHALVKALAHMFRTTILCPNSHQLPLNPGNNVHVLTYEDQEGDWMMVGDVPWEMFLTSVKKLKITRADRC